MTDFMPCQKKVLRDGTGEISSVPFRCFYAQARVRKIVAVAAHGPRSEQEGKTASYSIF